MSNRTIVEINHDYAAKIRADEAAFSAALGQALNSDASYAWDALRGFGVTRLASAHHSDEREVYINGRSVDARNAMKARDGK